MQFSVRLSLSLLGFFLISLFPQPARGQVSSPRRFRAKILSPSKLHVSWKEPKGEFESYKVIYTTLPGGEQKEVQVSKQEAKLLINDFDPSKEYNFKIVAVRGRQQSKPLQAKHEAQRSGVEVVQSQRTQGSSATEENNEISEGKIHGRETAENQLNRNPETEKTGPSDCCESLVVWTQDPLWEIRAEEEEEEKCPVTGNEMKL